MNIEQLNFKIFSYINAGADLHGYQFWIAIFVAKYLVIAIVLWIIGIWIWGSSKQRSTLLLAFIAVVISLLMNKGISLIWYHPRPIMMNLGHTYLVHASDSSFPSDHVTGLFSIGLILLWRDCRSLTSILILISTLCVAWGRIYLGLHFPLDMVGAIFVSSLSAICVIFISPIIDECLLPISEKIHRILFANTIKYSWKKE